MFNHLKFVLKRNILFLQFSFLILFRSFNIYSFNNLRYKWGCFVYHFNQQFSVFKQYYKYFHTSFHPHVFLHMFSNNKIHVFKCMYQTPLNSNPPHLNTFYIKLYIGCKCFSLKIISYFEIWILRVCLVRDF